MKLPNGGEFVTTRTRCRICGSRNLVLFLDLGETPLADAFVKKPDQPELYFPLRVVVCENCFLVQLIDIVDSDILFGDNYGFYTGASPSSIAYFEAYAKDVLARYPDQAKRFTLEIASNDGILLEHFKKAGCNVLGIDPAINVATEANNNGIPTLIRHFDHSTARYIMDKYGSASLILANNVVAHVDDLYDFMQGVKLVLDEDGLFIFECHYLPNLIFKNQSDNVYHEHRSFLALNPLKILFDRVGLKIIDATEMNTQGGSIRIMVVHKNSPAEMNEHTKWLMKREELLGLNKLETYMGFQARVDYNKQVLLEILLELKKQGKTIYGLGAPAKGNTPLNYGSIGTQYLDYLVDKTPYKIGKYSPGMHIPVIAAGSVSMPDYYLILPWNYLDGIMEREKKFRANGGKFIVPMPTPYII